MDSVSPRSLFVIFAVIVLSLFYLQSLFNDSDHLKAERWVRTHTVAPGGPTLEEWLDARHPEAHGGVWSTRILSGCHGYVRVTWSADTTKGPEQYMFDVDLPEHAIHPDPASPLGREALIEFARTGGAPLAHPASRPAANP